MAKVKVIVEGVEYEVDVDELPGGKFRVSFEGKSYEVEAKGLGLEVGAPANAPPIQASVRGPAVSRVSSSLSASAPAPTPAPPDEGIITAPMPGKILRILVKEGERVKTGQGLLVLEAMKMENEIPAPKDGVIEKIFVKEGDTVNTNDPLIKIR